MVAADNAATEDVDGIVQGMGTQLVGLMHEEQPPASSSGSSPSGRSTPAASSVAAAATLNDEDASIESAWNSIALGPAIQERALRCVRTPDETIDAVVDAIDAGGDLPSLLREAALASARSSPSVAPPCRADDFASSVFAKWLSESTLSETILFERSVAIDTQVLGGSGGHPFDLSLVAYDVNTPGGIVFRKVTLVAWLSVETLSCRPVQLDATERCIWPMAANVPRLNLGELNMTVVHPAIGIKIHRVGPRRKPPATILRLMQMWEEVERSSSRDAMSCSDTFECCIWCEHHGSSAACDVHTCSMCLLPWHSTCSRHFANAVVAARSSGIPPPVLVSGLPAEFTGVCAACKYRLDGLCREGSLHTNTSPAPSHVVLRVVIASLTLSLMFDSPSIQSVLLPLDRLSHIGGLLFPARLLEPT
jgi:hypothetical protein